MKANLIERLEHLIASLQEAQTWPIEEDRVACEIENALGIAGEILTMIDGR